MALVLRERVLECLKSKPEERLTARQIAEWVFENYTEECKEKMVRSKTINTDHELLQQIVAEIGSSRPAWQKKHTELKNTQDNPRKYYFSSDSDKTSVAESKSQEETKKNILLERNLYPLVIQYLSQEFGIHSKRIDEKVSKNEGKGSNHWLHPDIVSLEDLSSEWNNEVKAYAELSASKRAKLWSFEVKLCITRSNVRECFFQAVSNSSWANLGYLLTPDIRGDDTLKELRMLCSAHGIGVIKLNTEDISESQILIPAREKDELDLTMISRLTEVNRHFCNYMNLIQHFYKSGKINLSNWDAVPLE